MDGDRPQAWLRDSLGLIWARHFGDTPAVNEVAIAYCRPSKHRLGWIALSLSGRSSLIGINRLLGGRDVPEYVSTVTIAHELVHYCHGFGSPLPRRYADAHAGGVVERELEQRGLGESLRRYEEWAATAWADVYDRYLQGRQRPLPLLDVPSPALGLAPAAALDVAGSARRLLPVGG